MYFILYNNRIEYNSIVFISVFDMILTKKSVYMYKALFMAIKLLRLTEIVAYYYHKPLNKSSSKGFLLPQTYTINTTEFHYKIQPFET